MPGKHSKRDPAKQPEQPKRKIHEQPSGTGRQTELKKTKRKERARFGLRTSTDAGKRSRRQLIEAGYILAQGDKRSMVIINAEGEVYSLSRHVTDPRLRNSKKI